MGKRGPAPKPEGETAVIKSFSFPPKAWELIEEHIPKRERSAIVQRCLLEEAKRRKREAAPRESTAPTDEQWSAATERILTEDRELLQRLRDA